MKNILLTLMVFGIVGCSNGESSKIDYIFSVKLFGQCTDLESPSPFKEMDTYEVEGFYGLSECDKFCNSIGFIHVTEKENSKRDELLLKDLSNPDLIYMPKYERYKYYQMSDTPFVEVYSISEEIYLQDNWQLDAYHSYIGGENEDDNLYGMSKAECSLNVVDRQGIVTDDIRNKIDWCFDSICWGDNLMKKRKAEKQKET